MTLRDVNNKIIELQQKYDYIKKALTKLSSLDQETQKKFMKFMFEVLEECFSTLLRLQTEIIKDDLTDVYNKKHLLNICEQFKELPSQFKNSYLIFIDGDNFGAINKNYGHKVGDQVLKTVGSHLKNLVKSTDKVFRFGGDEFCIILENIRPVRNEEKKIIKNSDEIARERAEQIRHCLRGGIEYKYLGETLNITCSVSEPFLFEDECTIQTCSMSMKNDKDTNKKVLSA